MLLLELQPEPHEELVAAGAGVGDGVVIGDGGPVLPGVIMVAIPVIDVIDKPCRRECCKPAISNTDDMLPRRLVACALVYKPAATSPASRVRKVCSAMFCACVTETSGASLFRGTFVSIKP